MSLKGFYGIALSGLALLQCACAARQRVTSAAGARPFCRCCSRASGSRTSFSRFKRGNVRRSAAFSIRWRRGLLNGTTNGPVTVPRTDRTLRVDVDGDTCSVSRLIALQGPRALCP